LVPWSFTATGSTKPTPFELWARVVAASYIFFGGILEPQRQDLSRPLNSESHWSLITHCRQASTLGDSTATPQHRNTETPHRCFQNIKSLLLAVNLETNPHPSGLTMPFDAASSNSSSMLKAVGTGIALIGFCSAPALGSIVTRLNKRDAKQDTYEDGDGKATTESVKAYSARLPKSLVLASGAAGLATSIALLVISPRAEGRLLIDSLSTGAWVSPDTIMMSQTGQNTNATARVYCCSRLWR